MPNLMLSWQQAALLAAALGVAGVLLVRFGATTRAGRLRTHALTGQAADRRRAYAPTGRAAGRAERLRTSAAHLGPFFREAGVVVALYALWQLAGSLAKAGLRQAL